MVALTNPEESWVAKWQKIRKYHYLLIVNRNPIVCLSNIQTANAWASMPSASRAIFLRASFAS